MNTITTTRAQAGYIGLPTDPRREPIRLTLDYPLALAFTVRDQLREVFPKCEVFITER